MPHKNVVIFYARLPEKNCKCKTRIGNTINNLARASELGRVLTHDMLSEYLPISADDYDFIWCYKGDLTSYTPLPKAVTQYVKDNNGKLDASTIQKITEDIYEKIVIVGSDIPFVTHQQILEIFKQLDTHDVAIIPCEDKGYGAIGSKGFIDLYSDITNFDSRTQGYNLLHETNQIIKTQKLDAYYFPETFDIDTIQEVQRLFQIIQKDKNKHPHLIKTKLFLETYINDFTAKKLL